MTLRPREPTLSAARDGPTVKRCPHCESEQAETATVCQSCGKPFEESTSSTDHVRLCDVFIESLDSAMAREHCARTLLTLKRAATLDAAMDQLSQLPYPLFTHVTRDEAHQYKRLLDISGVDAKAQPSLIVCPYCHFKAELDGRVSERRDGVFYRCYSCNRKFFLSYRDHASHMLLECNACGTWLRLPVNPRVGRYRCVCGTMLEYLGGGQVAPPPRVGRPARSTVQAVRKAAAAEAEAVTQAVRRGPGQPWQLYGLVALVVVVLGMIFYLGLTLGPYFRPAKTQPAPSESTSAQPDERFKQFTAKTTHAQIVATLGAPRREALSADGKDKLLLYPERDFYVVVGRQGNERDLYRATFRLSDDRELHSAGSSPTTP